MARLGRSQPFRPIFKRLRPASAFVATFSDTITLSDAIAKAMAKPFADIITLSDAIVKRAGKVFAETITVSDGEEIADSYSEVHTNANAGGWVSVGQSFTGNGGTLKKAKFLLSATGTVTGNCRAKIYTHSGVFGTSSVPTGAALAISDDVPVSILPAEPDNQLVEFLFSGANRIILTNSTKYVVAFEYTGTQDAFNYINVFEHDYFSTHPGNESHYDGITWEAWNDVDDPFYVYTEDTTNIIKAVGKVLTDTTTLSDALSRVWTALRSFADTITLSDAISNGLTKIFSDTITLSDAILNGIGLGLSDTITLSDSIIKGFGKVLSDSITLSDALATKALGLVFSDTITLSDAIEILYNSFLRLPKIIGSLLPKSPFGLSRDVKPTGGVDDGITGGYTTNVKPGLGDSSSDKPSVR